MYDITLNNLQNLKKPLNLIVVGLGFMGFGFLSNIKNIPGIYVSLLISRRPEEAKKYLEEHGIAAAVENDAAKIKENAGKIISISDDLDLISKIPADAVFEVTGTIAYGAEVAVRALKSKKHLITMNPELQATVGTELKKIADEEKLIITDVYGDQPGSLTRLISSANLMGFEVLLAGNMKRYLDIYATQEKMQPWANDKGLAVRQTVSFTDGTKQAIEMTLVANYYGMKITEPGMKGPQVNDVKEVLNHFDWENLPKPGIVDYVIGKDLFPGVFIVTKHRDPRQQKYLRYLGLGEGPYYVLFEPYHLCHLEVIQTIAKALLFGKETINNGTKPLTATVARAKQKLAKGQKLDGIGGDTVYGMVDNIENCGDLLPVGLTQNAIMRNDIEKDASIKISDVILPVNTATKLAGLTKSPGKTNLFGSLVSRMTSLF